MIIIDKIAEWLGTILIRVDNVFFLDYWSFIHAFSGAFLMFILIRLKLRKYWAFGLLFTLLVLYEFLEWVLHSQGIWFDSEPFVDIYWDVIWGMLAGGVVYLFHMLFKKK